MVRPDSGIKSLADLVAQAKAAPTKFNYSSPGAGTKSHLTGELLAYYNKFSQQFIAPAARQGQLTATAKVLRAAVSALHPDSAVVLVFVNQNTASKKKPEPLTTASSVLVTLTKVNGSWLIAKLDPL